MTDDTKTNAQLMVLLAEVDGATEGLARLCLEYGLNPKQLHNVFQAIASAAWEEGYRAGKRDSDDYWKSC